jgi:import inner membrane translocase subunit TIM44
MSKNCIKLINSKRGIFSKISDSLKSQTELKKKLSDLREKTVENEAVKKAYENVQEKGKVFKDTIKENFQKATSGTKKKVEEKLENEKNSETFKKVKGYFDVVGNQWSSLKSTEAFKEIGSVATDTKKAVIDENLYKYGGLTSKAYREKIRKMRVGNEEERTSDDQQNISANFDASTIVIHKDSKWKESWNKFKDGNPVIQGIFSMRRRIDESDNILINAARIVNERIKNVLGLVFDETEHAQTLAEIRMIDPTFNLDTFMKETREFVIPEVLEAFIDWDKKKLSQWCSESVLSVLEASRQPLREQGLVSEGRLLDLRNVELEAAKMMDNNVPILILSFKTQQIEVVKNAKTGEIVDGSPDKVNDVFYVWVMTKDDKPNPLTKGWKVGEFAIQLVRESL